MKYRFRAGLVPQKFFDRSAVIRPGEDVDLVMTGQLVDHIPSDADFGAFMRFAGEGNQEDFEFFLAHFSAATQFEKFDKIIRKIRLFVPTPKVDPFG